MCAQRRWRDWQLRWQYMASARVPILPAHRASVVFARCPHIVPLPPGICAGVRRSHVASTSPHFVRPSRLDSLS